MIHHTKDFTTFCCSFAFFSFLLVSSASKKKNNPQKHNTIRLIQKEMGARFSSNSSPEARLATLERNMKVLETSHAEADVKLTNLIDYHDHNANRLLALESEQHNLKSTQKTMLYTQTKHESQITQALTQLSMNGNMSVNPSRA